MKVAALVLAAGRSSRMQGGNKLTELVDGKPIIARVTASATGSGACPVIIVVGHEHEAVEASVVNYDVTVVHNPEYQQGLSASLRCGLLAVPENASGVVVCLGDMPYVRADHIDRLITAFAPNKQAIWIPTFQGQRGNPVLWSRQFFAELMELSGDVGGLQVLSQHADSIFEVSMPDSGVLRDIDTPRDLSALHAPL